MSVRIHVGSAMEVLAGMPDESVQCCVTSPPYWGLRAYQGDPGMIGLEPTFDEHLANLVGVFGEVRRVLRKDGTLWLNYGDGYASSPARVAYGDQGDNSVVERDRTTKSLVGLKPKDLMMMPARVAMAMQADGWWLRSEIVWAKPNPMPESVTDRPTSAHEKMYLLSRSARYFYDAAAVRVVGGGNHGKGRPTLAPGDRVRQQDGPRDETPTASLRNVWSIPTFPFSASHFATFPPRLVEPCIKAGTSETGCCHACGTGWVRVVEHGPTTGWSARDPVLELPRHRSSAKNRAGDSSVTTKGWRPACACSVVDDVPPCVVLDPFAGAGTVGLVADRLGRDAVLIEISPEYAQMAADRIKDDNPMFAEVTTARASSGRRHRQRDT